jgi:putative heme-binding domain-containing protein
MHAVHSERVMNFRAEKSTFRKLPITDLLPAFLFLLCASTSLAGPGEGLAIYDSFCQICHGPVGEGQTMGKPLNDTITKNLSDAELIAVIRDGRAGTGMAAWAGSLSEQEILDVAGYIRVLQGEAGLSEVDESAVASDNPATRAGEQLFNGIAGCSNCHSYRDKGGNVGPKLDGIGSRLNDVALRQALLDPSASVLGGYEVKVVELPDGTVIKGRFRNDSEQAVQIQSPDGARWVTYFKARVTSITNSDESLMPDIFATLGAEQQNNLLAFLKSL